MDQNPNVCLLWLYATFSYVVSEDGEYADRVVKNSSVLFARQSAGDEVVRVIHEILTTALGGIYTDKITEFPKSVPLLAVESMTANNWSQTIQRELKSSLVTSSLDAAIIKFITETKLQEVKSLDWLSIVDRLLRVNYYMMTMLPRKYLLISIFCLLQALEPRLLASVASSRKSTRVMKNQLDICYARVNSVMGELLYRNLLPWRKTMTSTFPVLSCHLAPDLVKIVFILGTTESIFDHV